MTCHDCLVMMLYLVIEGLTSGLVPVLVTPTLHSCIQATAYASFVLLSNEHPSFWLLLHLHPDNQ